MSIMAVAKAAGVSHTTVSRVINNHPAVSPETVQQVQAAISRLGYVPPTKRRGPRSRARRGIHNRSIGLLVSNADRDDSGAPIIATLLEHVEQALAGSDLGLMFARINNDQPMPAIIRERRVDGLLVYGRAVSPAIAEQLEAFPCVWMLTPRGDLPAIDRVQPDNRASGRLAVEYLAGRGHRHVAVISSRPNDEVVRARAEAFVTTAAQRGLEAHKLVDSDTPEPRIPGQGFEYDLEPIRRRVTQLLSIHPRPTGLFVPNAELVALTYRALAEQGLQPGRDVDLICCNRNPLLLSLEPIPAVIDVRSDLVGRRAVHQLLWRMQHRHDPSLVQLEIQPRLLTPKELSERWRHGAAGRSHSADAVPADNVANEPSEAALAAATG